MSQNDAFCKDHYRLPQVRCEEWLGWVFVCLDPEAETVSDQLAEVADMIAAYDMTNYSESFYEEHVWDTNWKVWLKTSWKVTICQSATQGRLVVYLN